MPTSTVAESDLKECVLGTAGFSAHGDLDFCIRGTPLSVSGKRWIDRDGRRCNSWTKWQNRYGHVNKYKQNDAKGERDRVGQRRRNGIDSTPGIAYRQHLPSPGFAVAVQILVSG